jgi:hypothetical protein
MVVELLTWYLASPRVSVPRDPRETAWSFLITLEIIYHHFYHILQVSTIISLPGLKERGIRPLFK